MITIDDDIDIRRYARRLHAELGEDAYHEAVCQILTRGQADQIVNVRAFLHVALTRAFYKIIRHERAERAQTAAWLAGDPPPMTRGLVMGRQRQACCRQGRHALTDDNLAYIGVRRTCRTCKRARESAAGRARRRDTRR